MQFKDVIGQEIVKQKLIQSVNNNRISHAQLFLGQEGTGGLPLALAFAQFINCENKSEVDSCGTCSSCIKSQKLIHPDIHFSYPIITNKKEKKNKSTDYIKEWREALMDNLYLNIFQWILYLNGESLSNAKIISNKNKQGNI